MLKQGPELRNKRLFGIGEVDITRVDCTSIGTKKAFDFCSSISRLCSAFSHFLGISNSISNQNVCVCVCVCVCACVRACVFRKC